MSINDLAISFNVKEHEKILQIIINNDMVIHRLSESSIYKIYINSFNINPCKTSDLNKLENDADFVHFCNLIEDKNVTIDDFNKYLDDKKYESCEKKLLNNIDEKLLDNILHYDIMTLDISLDSKHTFDFKHFPEYVYYIECLLNNIISNIKSKYNNYNMEIISCETNKNSIILLPIQYTTNFNKYYINIIDNKLYNNCFVETSDNALTPFNYTSKCKKKLKNSIRSIHFNK